MAALLALAGCATPRQGFEVDAIKNDPVPTGRYSFRIVPAGPETTDDGIDFDALAGYVRTALSSKGMFEAPPDTPVDMVIEVDVGMEAPQVVMDEWNLSGWQGDDGPQRPRMVVYQKYLRITARETPAQAGRRPPREFWSIFVVTADLHGNLRKYVPLLISAAMDSIAENATTHKYVFLTWKDDRVVFLEKGM